MTIALTKLRGMIHTYSNYDFEVLSPDDLESLKTNIEEITQVLLWEIAEEYDNQKHPEIIGQIQSKLTFYAEAVANFEKDPKLCISTNEICIFLHQQVVRVLNHMRTYYPADFNLDALLPAHYTEIIQHHSVNEVASLLESLKNTGADEGLLSILKTYLSATGSSERFQIKTWRQLVFQQDVYKGLNQFSNCTKKDLTLELLKMLIALEFNSIQIYGYFIRYLEKITLGDQEFALQLERLSFLIKSFRQVRVEALTFYDPNAPSLKISVLESVTAEVAYVEQKEKIFLQTFKTVSPENSTNFYFKVAITLQELMFFFRVALEVTFIATKFKSYLYEFINNHIQTENAENLSKQSMRNHFNNKLFPDKVVLVVRTWLTKMIEHIDLFYKD
jgi:hypothetical protein